VRQDVYFIHVDAGAVVVRRQRETEIDRRSKCGGIRLQAYHRWKLWVAPAMAWRAIRGLCAWSTPQKPVDGSCNRSCQSNSTASARSARSRCAWSPRSRRSRRKLPRLTILFPSLPGVAQIAAGQPGLQILRIEEGCQESEIEIVVGV